MPRSWTITLAPMPRGLQANERGHRIEHNRVFQMVKEGARLQMLQAEIPRLAKVRISSRFYNSPGVFRSSFYFPKDEDNARRSLKPVQDALVSAQIVPDDSHRYVTTGPCEIIDIPRAARNRPENRARVEVTIQEVEPLP